MIGRVACIGVLALTLAGDAHSQAPATTTTPVEPTRDALGRDTPRGTLLGFLGAGRKGDNDLARHYLDAPVTGRGAEELARQLYVVLDARLPARLAQVSDAAEGSRGNPLEPDADRIGTIDGPSGPIPITVHRVRRPKSEPIWLFSRETLAAVPAAYADVERQHASPRVPRFLTDHRIADVRLAEWTALLLGLSAFYLMTVVLNRALTPAIAWCWRRAFPRLGGSIRNAVPVPVRLLLVCFAARWLFAALPLSLLVRQFLTNAIALVAIVAVTWLVFLLNGKAERTLARRVSLANAVAAVSLLRVGRRFLDVLIGLGGMLAMLRHFGVDPTPLLAGLGVGGIAVALAAQKTLENVIAGASLIVDQAVRVGDFLKLGEIQGTVEHIGLRSTRIRTLERSIVSVPNGQIANMSLETLSARDKFWFHPAIGLCYETTNDQMRLVLHGIRDVLARHPATDAGSVRVRFLRLGASSMDIEVTAYLFARDWPHFLEIQEDLLLTITEIVAGAGTAIAFPSQTLYVSGVNAATPQLHNAQLTSNLQLPK